jgi:hypothetical protein
MRINSIDIETLNEIGNVSIEAHTTKYAFNRSKDELVETLDGSVERSIVVNANDKQYINEDCGETKKLMNEEREARREMLFRQSRVLYPEKEEWILSLAVDAFMEQEERGIDITKHKFESDAPKY